MPEGVEVSPDGRSSTYHYGATGTAPSASALVDRALERMSGELDRYDAARNLITRWVEQDSSLSHLLTDALDEIGAREKRQVKSRTKQPQTAVRVGDLALIVTAMGPAFYRIRKIITDASGKLTALTLSDPANASTGQPVPVERVTAVIADVLNKQAE